MLLYLDYLPSLVIGMARIYPCGILVAAFCFQHVRGLPRHTIVMVLALLPAPGIHAALAGQDPSAIMLGALMIKEVVLGLLLGVLLAMPAGLCSTRCGSASSGYWLALGLPPVPRMALCWALSASATSS